MELLQRKQAVRPRLHPTRCRIEFSRLPGARSGVAQNTPVAHDGGLGFETMQGSDFTVQKHFLLHHRRCTHSPSMMVKHE
jgi:hypothetical protein